MAERWDFVGDDRVMDYRREQKRFYPYFVMNGKGRYRTVGHWERHIFRKFDEYDFKGNELVGFKTFCVNAKTRCGIYAMFANVAVKLMFGLVLVAALMVLFFEGYRNAVIDFVKGIIDFFGDYIGGLDVSKAVVFVLIAALIALLVSVTLYLLLKSSGPMLDKLASKIRFYEMLAETVDKYTELLVFRASECATVEKTSEEYPVLGKTAGEIERDAEQDSVETEIADTNEGTNGEPVSENIEAVPASEKAEQGTEPEVISNITEKSDDVILEKTDDVIISKNQSEPIKTCAEISPIAAIARTARLKKTVAAAD